MRLIIKIAALLLLLNMFGCASYDYLLCGDSGIFQRTMLGLGAVCNGDQCEKKK
jgi:hypothetical protein